ncbi:hypothetical protein AB0442_23215 [Kitasatospora sp. NPDC085895]|uniref:hypothetical protein n=1 Tax=Kitasatospora sp. NPDC085895 TaxID=3155057 RepID=UPI00344B7DC8
MIMNPVFQAALNGTLTSEDTGEGTFVVLQNSTDVPLAGYLVSDTGVWLGANDNANFGAGYPALQIPPGSTWGGSDWIDLGWYFILLNSYSGAFATVKQVSSGTSEGNTYQVTVNCADMLNPNDIGAVPLPNSSVLIPPDGPRVVVGCGVLSNGSVVAREQYWQRTPESYSIAKGEVRQENYTVTTGMEATSSQETTLAASLNVGASAGWGPISASMSAALNASATSFQSITTTTEQTSYIAETYDNTGGSHPDTYFYWQLTNVVTIFDPNGSPLSSLIYGAEGPAIISGPWDFNALPPRPLTKESAMSETMRARLLRAPTLAGQTGLHR